MGSARPKRKCNDTPLKMTMSASDSGRALPSIFCCRALVARGAFSRFSAQFCVVAACMDPLVEYGTALLIGTSLCRQKGEGTEGIYAADAHAAAAAAAAAGSYRTRGHFCRHCSGKSSSSWAIGKQLPG